VLHRFVLLHRTSVVAERLRFVLLRFSAVADPLGVVLLRFFVALRVVRAGTCTCEVVLV
jgi:hypothetical protein